MVVEDNTFKCGFCVNGTPRKMLVASRTYKMVSTRPCSTCILPHMLISDKPQEPQIIVPEGVKGFKI
jgi:hypothetical protein